MSGEPLTILHLEDSEDDALLVARQLGHEFPGLRLLHADGRKGFLQALPDLAVRLVLSDYSIPGYDGLQAFADTRRLRPELPFIFVSGVMGEDMAVECMRLGASDYVLKSNPKRLAAAVRRALNEVDARQALMEAARVARVVPWHWNAGSDTWLFGPQVKEILGYQPDLLESTPGFLRSRVHLADQPRFGASFRPSAGADPIDLDCRILHVDGRWLWTHWTVVWSEGRCRGVLQDISELRGTQDALIQSQRLELLGSMLSGITHDFGNLVQAMSSAVALLQEASPAPEQRPILDILARSCVRALDFKRQLLGLARKEGEDDRTRLQVGDLVQECAGLLRHTLPRNIEVAVEAEAGLPEVLGVPSRLLQVLVNLAVNARDAMGESGRLTLRAGQSVLSPEEAEEVHLRPGPCVILAVEDTGPGIPAEVVSRIFEPFFTTKGQGKGTGLGLAMVRAIVQQHDGTIQVQSAPGAGASFRILLPAAPGAADPAIAEP